MIQKDNFINKGRVGSEYWVNSGLKSFGDICKETHTLFDEWKNPEKLLKTEYNDKILKPINSYVVYFYPKPTIIVKDNFIILRQKTHAEIWVEPKNNGLYALDKTWQRQFYPSESSYTYDDECFNALYRFYVPWTIDTNKIFKINSVSDSCFKIKTKEIKFNKVDYLNKSWDCNWIDFYIKNKGDHMKDYFGEDYGIIDIGTPMYDIVINDKDVAERIISEYEK